MFRVRPHIIRASLRLLRRSPLEIQVASISRTPVANKNNKIKKFEDQERDPCPQPKPVKVPPADDKLLWGTVAVILIAGGFAVMARKNPEIRDWLTIRAPWFDDFIAVIHEENKSIMESVIDFGSSCKLYLAKLLEDKPQECSLDGAPIAPAAIAGGDDDDDDDDDDEDDDEEDNEESPCDILPPPVVTKDICEIESCMKDLGDNVLHNYMTARDACIYYNKLVHDTMGNFSFPALKKLKPEMEDRIDLVQKSIEKAEEALVQLNDLSRYIECGCAAPKDRMEVSYQMMRDYQAKIDRMKFEYQQHSLKSEERDSQWQIVEKLLDVYADQNESMYKGLSYMEKRPSISDDTDFLLILTKKYEESLRAQVEEASAAMSERVDRGVKAIPKTQKEIDAMIASAYKEASAAMAKDYADRYADQKTANDVELQQALKKQKEEHEATLDARLAAKEKEVQAKFDRLVAENVAAQRRQFAKELGEMAAKLKIVEDKLNEKLKAERESKRAQELWSAAASLLRATKKGDPVIKIDRELKAIQKASGDDKLVVTVLKAIPDEAWEKGIVPESKLKERYHTMEDVARKVAMVESEGAPLPLYAFSWLQGLLLFMKISGIPQKELDNPPKEPFQDLDTFDTLQRARYFIERGNLAMAVRYVDSLQGASRGAAEDWHSSATAHLHTRQAAEAILAHAAAICLQYL